MLVQGKRGAYFELIGEAPDKELTQPAVVHDCDFKLFEVPFLEPVLCEQFEEMLNPVV